MFKIFINLDTRIAWDYVVKILRQGYFGSYIQRPGYSLKPIEFYWALRKGYVPQP